MFKQIGELNWVKSMKLFKSPWILFATACLIGLLLSMPSYYKTSSGSNLELAGGCSDSNSPFFKTHFNDGRRISYCSNGDKDTGAITSSYVAVSDFVTIQYSGYPESPGISVYVEGESGYSEIISPPNVGERWAPYEIKLRDIHRFGGRVRVKAVDSSSADFSWIGIASDRVGSIAPNIFSLLKIVLLLSFIHLVFSLYLMLVMRRTSPELALIYFIVGLGLIGWITFWGYFFSRKFGLLISLFVFLFAAYLFYLCHKRSTWKELLVACKILLPCTSLALFVVLVGYYPYPASDSVDWTVAANRWLSLPIDNWIPQIFAKQIWAGNLSSPMLGDWLSSDRPPLQTGIYLLFYPLAKGDGYLYQTLSSIFQATILLAALLVGKRIHCNPFPAIMIAGLGLSSLVVFHTLFVWPKLLSASFLLIVYFLLLMREDSAGPLRPQTLILAGISAALGMLSHGGAIFSLMAIGVVYLWHLKACWKQQGAYRGLGFVFFPAITAILVYLPWIGYQAWYDPPGNRLMKWHLAGVVEPNQLGTFEAIHSAYSQLTFSDWIASRYDNLNVILSGTLTFFVDVYLYLGTLLRNGESDGKKILASSFFETAYSFWFISPVFIVVLYCVFCTFRKKDMKDSKEWQMLVTAGCSFLFWTCFMYLPGSTIIHQGSFFQWAILFVALTTMAWRISRSFFVALLMLNILLLSILFLGSPNVGNASVALYYFPICFISLSLFLFCCLLSSKAISYRFENQCQIQ